MNRHAVDLTAATTSPPTFLPLTFTDETVPPITDPHVPDWEGAACRTGDPDLWFPEKGDAAAAQRAARICATCPLRDTCLDYAVRHHERHGVWGGLTERQRRQVTRPVLTEEAA